MMHEFLTANRTNLIDRCRAKVAHRAAPAATRDELDFGIPLFLDQLIKTLRAEQTTDPMSSRAVSGPSGGVAGRSEMGETAALHGRELQASGFNLDQVVHDYGDLCQAITDLAVDSKAPIAIDEFRTLNRCLDNAIAVAVTEFSYQRDFIAADRQAHDLNQRLGFFAHELRNLLNTATLALTAIKAGSVGLDGATGAILDRSLVGLRNLIDKSLTEVKMTAGMAPQHRVFSLADFIAEVQLSAALEAQVRRCGLNVTPVDPRLGVDADRELLLAAVGNLLQNAFKFTHIGSEVSLAAYASSDRIFIDVADHCGGLPVGFAEKMFVPFSQGNVDRSGLGLGLSISRRSVEANAGKLGVRDVPGTGCVFTIELPRHAFPQVSGKAQVLFA
jgi:signal transduction histidine kinase